jgi:L-aspartate oxidase
LHGANRLASNSLLEGLAFGARAGLHAAESAKDQPAKFPQNLEHRIKASDKTELDLVDVKSSLRSVMWRNAGIERTSDRLAETREIISFWSRYVMDKTFMTTIGHDQATAGWELQNMLTACFLITSAAYTRTESLLWRRPMETPIPEPIPS